MRLLVAATPAAGHLNPLLSLVRLMIAERAEVLVTTGTEFAEKVRATGARFEPLRGKADLDFSRFAELFPERATLPIGPAHIRFDMEHVFIDTIADQAATLSALTAEFRPDVIITDSMFFGRLPLFYGAATRPPIIGFGITFLTLPRPDNAPLGLGLPPAGSAAERDRYAAIAREVDAALVDPVDAHLRTTLTGLGVTPPPCGYFKSAVVANDVFLQPTVRSFEYDFGDPGTDLRFVGALPPTPIDLEKPDWWDRLDHSRPIVLVTQGTVANRDFEELVNPTVQALAGRDDVQLVVTTGGRPIDDVVQGSGENVFVATYVDYNELVPRLSGLITNGGYGGVSVALQAGVPVIAVGRSEDKAEIGARVAWSGVGIELPTVTPKVSDLLDAVERLLAEPTYRARARELAAEFRTIDTSREILRAIHEVVSAGNDRK